MWRPLFAMHGTAGRLKYGIPFNSDVVIAMTSLLYLIEIDSARVCNELLTRALENAVATFTQATLTSICFGWACSLFGTCIVSTPSLNSAFTLLKSASSGRAKLRMKVP